MGILYLVVLGAFVGWLGAAIAEVDEGVFVRMAIGSVGAVLGGLTVSILLGEDATSSISLVGTLFGLVGAIVLLGLFNKSTNYNSRDSHIA